MHTTTRLAAILLSGALAVPLLTGCGSGDGCAGEAYHPDLNQEGAETPIQSLDVWLNAPEGIDNPPVENWIVVDSGDAEPTEVIITNDDGNGWWVSTVKTLKGGWVVSAATDDAAACGDELT